MADLDRSVRRSETLAAVLPPLQDQVVNLRTLD